MAKNLPGRLGCPSAGRCFALDPFRKRALRRGRARSASRMRRFQRDPHSGTRTLPSAWAIPPHLNAWPHVAVTVPQVPTPRQAAG